MPKVCLGEGRRGKGARGYKSLGNGRPSSKPLGQGWGKGKGSMFYCHLSQPIQISLKKNRGHKGRVQSPSHSPASSVSLGATA